MSWFEQEAAPLSERPARDDAYAPRAAIIRRQLVEGKVVPSQALLRINEPVLALRMNHGSSLAPAYARRRFHSVEQSKILRRCWALELRFTHPNKITVGAGGIAADRPRGQRPRASVVRVRTIASLHLALHKRGTRLS